MLATVSQHWPASSPILSHRSLHRRFERFCTLARIAVRRIEMIVGERTEANRRGWLFQLKCHPLTEGDTSTRRPCERAHTVDSHLLTVCRRGVFGRRTRWQDKDRRDCCAPSNGSAKSADAQDNLGSSGPRSSPAGSEQHATNGLVPGQHSGRIGRAASFGGSDRGVAAGRDIKHQPAPHWNRLFLLGRSPLHAGMENTDSQTGGRRIRCLHGHANVVLCLARHPRRPTRLSVILACELQYRPTGAQSVKCLRLA